MNKRAFWCWFPWIVVVIVIIFCWSCPKPQIFKADLTILDETTAAWAVTNNTFAGGHPDPNKDRDYWTGILFQLGQAEGAEKMYKSVQFFSGGVLKGEAPADTATWINIVAEVPNPSVDAPMPESVFPLIDGSCQTDTTGCLRCRRLHAHLFPKTIMTYWQGPGGWAAQAKQSTGSFMASNEQQFDFRDRFNITCYRTKNGALDVIDYLTFAPGEIDEIRVTNIGIPPGSGVKVDPPWPGP